MLLGGPSQANNARVDAAPTTAANERRQRHRVLVAQEPLAYRQAMAAALAELRPAVEFAVVAPQDLDAEVVRNRPDLVFCSQLGEVVWMRTSAWALLYPGGRRMVEVCIDGERACAPDLGLDDALALVDLALRLASGA